jgi:hypothetical protein
MSAEATAKAFDTKNTKKAKDDSVFSFVLFVFFVFQSLLLT